MKTNLQYYLLISTIILANHFNLHPAARITTTSDNEFSSIMLGQELIAAALKGDNKKIATLINRGADVNFKDYHGCTSLMQAAYSGHFESVKLLIKLGANVNAVNTDIPNVDMCPEEAANTALMIAVCGRYKDIVELLIQNKADVNIADINNETALFHSVNPLNGTPNFEIVKLLIDAGSNIAALNTENHNIISFPLDRLFSGEEYDIDKNVIRLLIDSGADIDHTGNGNPLYLALAIENIDILSLLLTNGANINRPHMLEVANTKLAGMQNSNIDSDKLKIPKIQEIIELLKTEPERRQLQTDKWKTLMANKVTSATGNQLVNPISKIVSEYTIDTYKDVVKLEKEDEINKWQTLIANNITKATGKQLPKDISKVVSEYILRSNIDVCELEEIEKDNNFTTSVNGKHTTDSGENIIKALLKSSEELEKNKLKRKQQDSDQESDSSKKTKLSASSIKALVTSLNEKLNRLNAEMSELLNSPIDNSEKIEQKQEEIDTINLEIKLLISSLKNAKA